MAKVGLLLVLLMSVFGGSDCLECYQCYGSMEMSECITTVTCKENEVCYKNRTFSGQLLYDLGCSNKQDCGGYAGLTKPVSAMSENSGERNHCHECCSTNNCNKEICVYNDPSLCTDDDNMDCAFYNSLFDICKNINQAKKYCPKYCGLCHVVDGNWSPWSSWSDCDVTCEHGTRTRVRSCTDPAPQYGGHECPGNAREETPCLRDLCPVHGGWSEWNGFGSCSVSCGIGTQRRNRTCSNPFPSRFGDHCFGDSHEITLCHPGPCSDGGWAEWETWSNCSVECGGGFRTRSRTCSPTSTFGGVCPGTPYEIGACGNGNCDGEWAEWETWSNCSVECGGGFRTRSRTCSSTSTFGGVCPGTPYEIGACGNGNCVEPVGFSMWYPDTTSGSGTNPLKFNTLIYNTGNGYDQSTGVFTCQHPGLYFFTATVIRSPGSTSSSCYMYVNDTYYLRVYSGAHTEKGDKSGSGSIVFMLQTGDRVYLTRCGGIDYIHSYSSFSGFRIGN